MSRARQYTLEEQRRDKARSLMGKGTGRASRRAPLERTVENNAVQLARSHGWLARKMNGMGYNDWPDRLFLPPVKSRRKVRVLKGTGHYPSVACDSPPRAFWVEFKRLGKQLTPKQKTMQQDLEARGERVYGPVDTYEEFREIFAQHHRR